MHTKIIKILLIEENKNYARYIKDLLEEPHDHKFEITVVSRLSKGLLVISNENIDAVILDLSHPECIGSQTFRKLRTHTSHVPIIVLTTRGDHSHIKVGIEGAQNFISKESIDRKLLADNIVSSIEQIKIHKNLSKHFNSTEAI